MTPSFTAGNYTSLYTHFRWQVPPQFNIAEACCGRWAREPSTARQSAIIVHQDQGQPQAYSYAELQQVANALSRALAAHGVVRGQRVALVLPQSFACAAAYLAVFQLGAVATPLSLLFGPDALEYRLQDSGAVCAVVDNEALARLTELRARCPALHTVLAVGAPPSAQVDGHYEEWLRRYAGAFSGVATSADEAAVLIYTSGTTGPPKGALIAHRALIGNLSGFVCSQNWFGFDGVHNHRSEAVFWSPADWAWTGGLMDALLPTLFFGRPIVAYRGRFNPERAFALMQAHGVSHSFLFPTALKAMMKAFPTPRQQFKLRLQAIMSAGEAVGDAVFDYCQQQLGVCVNEMFGQTEINYIVGNCAMAWATPHRTPANPALGWPAKPGSMGKPYPGHRVAVIDDEGAPCPPGVAGEVAVNRYDLHGQPDPVFFLGYWNNEQATTKKFSGDWCRTGDMAVCDADGYLWYQGRADDMFKAAGYRIGPSEVENCLVKHPAVANAAVVPKPDAERGALVKAYVVLAPEYLAAQAVTPENRTAFERGLIAELQAHVRGKLAPYEYPKEIEFIEQLPMTTTGKVQRRVLRQQELDRSR